MKLTKNVLLKSEVELTIELSIEELTPYMEEAAAELSVIKKVEGFRPGKVPYAIMKQRFGDMAILQHATNAIIGKTYYDAIEQENLDVVEQPKIDVVKIAPGNPFVYKATVALIPEITIADFSKIKIKPLAEIKVAEDEVNKVVADLQKMRAKETLENKPAEKGDKVELNFDVFLDNVPIEGGQARKHLMVIGDSQMIPGFDDNVIGLKQNDEKEFALTFPKKYFDKKLAGKEALFKIKVLAVYKVELPAVDDAFAKSLGLPDYDSMKKHIENNLTREKEQKAKEKQELEIIELLIAESKFGELPDVLVNEETHKMFHELEDNVARQGMKVEDYLSHIKKTEAELRLDFTEDAIKRVKTALLMRSMAQRDNISADEKEVDAEIERSIASYKLHPSYQGQINDLEKSMRSENGKRYFQNLIGNRKVMEYLKKQLIKQ